MLLSKKITKTVTKVVRIQVCFFSIGSKNNNNKHVEYHVIFIPFKGQIYSKQGSQVSLLFGTCGNFSKTLVNIIFLCLRQAEVSSVNFDLTNFVDAQRVDENVKWVMHFWKRLAILCLQKRYSFSAFIRGRIYTSKILHSAAIPVALTKN